MGGKHGHSYTGATHITKVFVKRTILFFAVRALATVTISYYMGGKHAWTVMGTQVQLT